MARKLRLAARLVLGAFDGDFDRRLTMKEVARAVGIHPLPADSRKWRPRDPELCRAVGKGERMVQAMLDALTRDGDLVRVYGRIRRGRGGDEVDRWRLATDEDRQYRAQVERRAQLALDVAEALGGGDKYGDCTCGGKEDDEEQPHCNCRMAVIRAGAVASFGEVEIRGPALEKLADVLRAAGLMKKGGV